jgi:AraC family transcriptional regulator
MRPIIPCAAAMAALGVPARRWTTRADLLKQLEKAVKHLDTAPLDEVSLTTAAEAAGLSEHHFLRLFKETRGTTPYKYLTNRRVEEAKRLLRETDYTVGEVAAEVGLTSQSAFGRLFRAHTGIPALIYRLASRAEAN